MSKISRKPLKDVPVRRPKSGSGAAPRIPAAAGYSGTPLPKKLGVKPGARVTLLDAPDGFSKVLQPLPDGVRFSDSLRAQADLILWFVTSAPEYTRRLASVRRAIGRDGLWVIWPKKASGVVTDMSENVVRDAALATGIVDYKVCAVDQTWSGLKFAVRKKA